MSSVQPEPSPAPDFTIEDLIEAAVCDLDERTATALRGAMIGTYRLGAAVMRRQVLEVLSELNQETEGIITSIELEGIREEKPQ